MCETALHPEISSSSRSISSIRCARSFSFLSFAIVLFSFRRCRLQAGNVFSIMILKYSRPHNLHAWASGESFVVFAQPKTAIVAPVTVFGRGVPVAPPSKAALPIQVRLDRRSFIRPSRHSFRSTFGARNGGFCSPRESFQDGVGLKIDYFEFGALVPNCRLWP